ncbi:MAG: anaerobic sulfatase maturase, partial [Odoribacter sp.]|nr:anaerobic sulfatase maturase [Odoribacter sp.]
MEKKTASFIFEQEREKLQRSFSVMLKTAGPLCNLDCDYCYYLEKDALYPGKKFNLSSFRMNEEVLEKLIRDFIASQPQQKIEFVWHGGEPTLLGIEYFRKAIALQKKYAGEKEILNSFQTNGTLITDEWAEFLAENNFLCGLSIDGPKKFHDAHRRFPTGQGSWEKVVDCARLFRKHGVEFNTMSVVNASNSKEPATVYEFLKSIGSRFMQFTPIAERITLAPSDPLSIVDNSYAKAAAMMQENVGAADWGNFLCRIFDIWVKNDVGNCFVNYFDNTLAAYAGQQPSLCSMAPYCGCSLAIEHNGDVYACDHFVFEDYKLGNLFEKNIADMAKSDQQLFFEQRKQDTLSQQCQNCPFIKACGGDCPKNRFVKNEDGEFVSCLCEGFRMFFNHTRKHFEFMANELKHQRPPA